MPKITAIIAYMPITRELVDLTIASVKAFSPLVDKMIVVQNGIEETVENASEELLELSDIFLVNKSNRLHAGAINQGVMLANPGEYLAVINNDVFPGNLDREGFEKLCVPESILSPQVGDQAHNYGAHASFFVCRRSTFNKVGWWDLGEGHEADEDWFTRAKYAGINMQRLDDYTVEHKHPASTLKLVGKYNFKKGEY